MQLLEAEHDEHLGYERYQQTEEPKTNARKGYAKKTVRSIFGGQSCGEDITPSPTSCTRWRLRPPPLEKDLGRVGGHRSRRASHRFEMLTSEEKRHHSKNSFQ